MTVTLREVGNDLLETLRTAGTVDTNGEPIIAVTDEVQQAMNRMQAALDALEEMARELVPG